MDNDIAIGQALTVVQPRQNRLRAYRLAAGLTQEEVAEALANLAWERDRERLAVDANHVSKWERGVIRPRKFYRRLFCILYGATEADLGLRPRPSSVPPSGGDLARSGVPVGGLTQALPQFNGSLPGLLAASRAEAVALVSGAARARYDRSTLIAQAYATADDLAVRYLTSPPAPILAAVPEVPVRKGCWLRPGRTRGLLTRRGDRSWPTRVLQLARVAEAQTEAVPPPGSASASHSFPARPPWPEACRAGPLEGEPRLPPDLRGVSSVVTCVLPVALE